jgi:hypothetical protein
VVHKPTSGDGRGEGLTVQDPPRGWPFSEVHINFDSNISEKGRNGASSIDTHHSEDGSSGQNEHQRENRHSVRQQHNAVHRQKLKPQPQYEAAIRPHGDTHSESESIKTTDSRKFSQPSAHTVIAGRNRPFGFVSGKGEIKTVNALKENIPKEMSELQRRPSLGRAAPAHRSAHGKQPEVSASGGHMLGDGFRNIQQQQHHSATDSVQQSAEHYQATSSDSIQQKAILNGDRHYMWRDVGPGLEISSNAPQLAGGSRYNLAEVYHPHTNGATKEEQERTTSGHRNVGGQSLVTGTNLKVSHASNFDHANALGHSANFGHRDAILSLPVQFQTGGPQAYEAHTVSVSPRHETGLDQEGAQYKNADHKTQNSLPDDGKSGEDTGTVLPGTAVSPDAAEPTVKVLGGQYSQQQTHSQTNSLLPQTNYPFDSTAHKALLRPNKGLIQGIAGSQHANYDPRNVGTHNQILFPYDMVNTGGHLIPLQVVYIPVSSPHMGQLGNHQTQAGTVDHVQQSIPTFDASHTGQGIINNAAMPYIGLMNRGLFGYTGIGGLPILQGDILGIRGGTALPSHPVGTHHLSVSSGVSVSDNNLAQDVYKPAFQSALQATGHQQHSPVQAQGNHQTALTAGQEALRFQNTVPYQYQQENKQHGLAPLVRVHPHGTGLRLLQRHPVPHKNGNSGGFHRLPLGGHQYLQPLSGFPAHDHAASVPNRSYQTFSLSAHPHQPISRQHTAMSNPLVAAEDTQFSPHRPQEVLQPQAVVQRNERASKQSALPKIERLLLDKGVEGRHKRYFGSKPMTTGPLSHSVITTNSHYAIGMRPRNSDLGFIRK